MGLGGRGEICLNATCVALEDLRAWLLRVGRRMPALALPDRPALGLCTLPGPPLPWQPQPSSLAHFLDIFDLEISVEDKLLGLWLPGAGPAGCAVRGVGRCPASRLGASLHVWLSGDSKTCSCR